MGPASLSTELAPRSGASRDERGLTLIEIIVVIAIIALVVGVAVAGSMQLPSARLAALDDDDRQRDQASPTRARPRRRATAPRVRSRRQEDLARGERRADARPVEGQDGDRRRRPGDRGREEAPRRGREDHQGPADPQAALPRRSRSYGFGDVGVDARAASRSQRGITFRSVQTAHDDAARTSGRAYLYFWPGGQTERAAIQLRIGDSIDGRSTRSRILVSPAHREGHRQGRTAGAPAPHRRRRRLRAPRHELVSHAVQARGFSLLEVHGRVALFGAVVTTILSAQAGLVAGNKSRVEHEPGDRGSRAAR